MGIKSILFDFEKDLKSATSPLDLFHIRILRISLIVIGAWPPISSQPDSLKTASNFERLTVPAYKDTVNLESPKMNLSLKRRRVPKKSHYLFLVSLTILILQVKYLKDTDRSNFLRMGYMYVGVMMNVVYLSRILLPQTEGYIMLSQDFFTKVHLFHHKDKSDYAMKTYRQVHRISHIFSFILFGQTLIGIILYTLTPLYTNLRSGAFFNYNISYELSIYYAFPIDQERELIGYIIVSIINPYLSLVTSTGFCIIDLYLSLIIFQLWGHLKILKQLMENFPKTRGVYSGEETRVVEVKLKVLVDYHRYIKNFASRISDTFGAMIFVYLGFHQVCGCLLLLGCAQMDTKALGVYVPMTVIVFQQLIQMSIVFELIGSMSENLIDAAYRIPWECMSVPSRKLVLMLLRSVQKTIHLKAMGVADVGVQTMVTILKTSMSYFTFLQSVPT